MRYNNNNSNKRWNTRKPRQNEGLGQGIMVEVRNNDVNKALRLFKKKVQNEGILQEYKERQHYVKPSEKRRKAKAAGKKRWLKKQKESQLSRGY